MTLPTRLIALLLGLAWAVLLTGAPAGPAAAQEVAAFACTASTDAAGHGGERLGAAAADAAGETEAAPARGLPDQPAGHWTAGLRPQREPVPRAPWLAGLLRPPSAGR